MNESGGCATMIPSSLQRWVAAALALATCACTSLPQRVATTLSHAEIKASELRKRVGAASAPEGGNPGAVVHAPGIWIAKEAVAIDKQPVLSPVFYEQATFDRSISSLADFAERITNRSGIAVRVAPDALTAARRAVVTGGAGSLGLEGASMRIGAPTPTPSPIAGAVPPTAGGAVSAAPMDVRITYSGGNLKGLLDTAAARLGVFWRYKNNAIEFYYTDTRTFTLNSIPGDTNLSNSITSGASSDVVGASANGATKGIAGSTATELAIKSKLSVWPHVEASVKSMLSGDGKVVASPSTGTITVTDTPDILDRVAAYIDRENKGLSKQIVMSVTVLAVTLDESDAYGIDWNLIYNTAKNQFKARNLVASDSMPSMSVGIIGQGSSWNGSQILINALSEQGKVRRETSTAVTTLNNQPVPVQVATQTTYLASSQTTFVPNVGATTTVTPGTVTSGFNLTLLPHILDNGIIQLQFGVDLSTLRQIRSVKFDNTTIEMPEIDTRNFLQRVSMKSGETLVISGFEQAVNSSNGQGVGHPANLLMGKSKVQSGKDTVVIVITPVVVGA